MTSIAKAIAFAQHCLKWTDITVADHRRGALICDGKRGSILSFCVNSAEDIEFCLQEFLGKRYFIQINRGTTSLFRWTVIVGWQDRTDKTKTTDNAQAEGEDLWDVIFDACVQAAHLYAAPITRTDGQQP